MLVLVENRTDLCVCMCVFLGFFLGGGGGGGVESERETQHKIINDGSWLYLVGSKNHFLSVLSRSC